MGIIKLPINHKVNEIIYIKKDFTNYKALCYISSLSLPWGFMNPRVKTHFVIYSCVMTIWEKAMAPHSSTVARKIPWMEEPGRLQSMGSLRVGHDWATSFHFALSCIGEGNGNPLQCSCLENPRDREAWWAAVYGVAKSRTRLKRLSSSSRIINSV